MAPQNVWLVWDISDEYRPDLLNIYATKELAEEKLSHYGQRRRRQLVIEQFPVTGTAGTDE